MVGVETVTHGILGPQIVKVNIGDTCPRDEAEAVGKVAGKGSDKTKSSAPAASRSVGAELSY